MSARRDIFFAAHPTVGHTSALRAIAAELRVRGHRTHFALVHPRPPFASRWPEPVRVAASLPGAIAAEGAQVHALPGSPAALWHAARLPRATGQAELEIALALFTSGLATQARHLASLVRNTHSDIVVGDYLMPAAMLGAQAAGRPFVALYHSALPFPAEGAPPFGTELPASACGSEAWRAAESRLARMSAYFDGRVAAAARALGVRAPGEGLLLRPISPDLNLLATAPVLEPGLLPLAGPVVMTGPCLPAPSALDDAGRAVLDALPRDRRIVYVSLGTVFNDRPAVYRALIEGAAATGAHLVVSAGASVDALAGLRSASVQIHRRVPQVPLLARVHAVITHGGNNTVQECLAAGRPMVVIPFGGDQRANAHRVERLGAGVRIAADALSRVGIQSALDTLFQSHFVSRSAELAHALTTSGGTRAAADAVLAG